MENDDIIYHYTDGLGIKETLGRPDLMGDPFPLFIGECYRMQETLLKLIKENMN